jgi:uncharacterized membrane protein
MKKAWSDLKSFVTVTLTLTLVAIIIVSLFFDKKLDQNLLLLFTNITTSVFTYYFTKKEDTTKKAESIGNTEEIE